MYFYMKYETFYHRRGSESLSTHLPLYLTYFVPLRKLSHDDGIDSLLLNNGVPTLGNHGTSAIVSSLTSTYSSHTIILSPSKCWESLRVIALLNPCNLFKYITQPMPLNIWYDSRCVCSKSSNSMSWWISRPPFVGVNYWCSNCLSEQSSWNKK